MTTDSTNNKGTPTNNNGNAGFSLLGKLDPTTAVVIALLAGGGSAGLNAFLPGVRADAFTKTDAVAMEEKRESDLREMENRLIDRFNVHIQYEARELARVEGKLDGHLDMSDIKVNEYNSRLTRIEVLMETNGNKSANARDRK